jgi:4-hydroxybenzoate polyprenyltransferase
MQSVRDILLCLLVFFAGTLFLNIVSGAIIAILLYLILRYRKRIKELEKRTGSANGVVTSDVPSSSEP